MIYLKGENRMNVNTRKKIFWKRALILDEEFFQKVDDIYGIIDNKPHYNVWTEQENNYQFETTEDFINYELNEKIVQLTISEKIQNANSNRLKFNFGTDIGLVHRMYGQICECTYIVNNLEKEAILKESINQILKKKTQKDWLVGKIGIFNFVMLFFAIAIIIDYCINGIDIYKYSTNELIWRFVTGILLGPICLLFCISLNYRISRYFFNPLIFYLGIQKEKTDSINNLKHDILWGIIIAIIVGIITTIITNNI